MEVHKSGISMFNISGSEVYQASLIDLIVMAILFTFLKADHFIEVKTVTLRKPWRIGQDKGIKGRLVQ